MDSSGAADGVVLGAAPEATSARLTALAAMSAVCFLNPEERRTAEALNMMVVLLLLFD